MDPDLEALIEAVTVTRTTAEWLALLDQANVPVGPVLRYHEALQDPGGAGITHPGGHHLRQAPGGWTVNDTDPLLLTRDGAVVTLTINRPERLNALSYAMFQRLPKLLDEAAALPGVRALVLRGAGTRAFSAGADISEFETARMTREHAAAYDDAVLAAEEAITCFPATTLAAVHGHCYGGGCGLAVACDIRFAAAGARFAITPAKLGLVYPLRGTKRLVDLVGPSRAKIMLMSGADYSAAQAQAFGLADEVFSDPAALDAGVREFTTLLAARSGVTQRAVKVTVDRITDGTTHDDESHALLRESALESPDYAEGVRAFLEHRPPVFG
jgi:enoyl-CoA hydratase/carnithine racemase